MAIPEDIKLVKLTYYPGETETAGHGNCHYCGYTFGASGTLQEWYHSTENYKDLHVQCYQQI